MSRLLPHRPAVEVDVDETVVVDLTDDADADRIEALAADTSRAVLSALHDEPTTASNVADAVDTSLQNAHYHLRKLADAGLVDVVETWYSERGSEMPVYAPAGEAVVLTVDDERESSASDREAPAIVA